MNSSHLVAVGSSASTPCDHALGPAPSPHDVVESDANRVRQDTFLAVLSAVEACRPAVAVPGRNPDASWLAFAPGAFGEWGIAQVHDGRLRVEARIDCGEPMATQALLELVDRVRDQWSRSSGVELTVHHARDHRTPRIAAHHPALDLGAMSEEDRVELVLWAVRTIVAMHDTMDGSLRHHAELLGLAISA